MSPSPAEIAETLLRLERLAMKNAEVIGIVNERQLAMREDMTELKDHQKEANGRMAEVSREQHEQRGGLVVLRWMVATLLASMGVGVGLAGVILAVVSGG